MPGKALSLLALSLMLETIVQGACCQASKSYTGSPPSAPYKHNLHSRGRSQPANVKAAQAGAAAEPSSLAPDQFLSYRGLTHDTVLTALTANPYVSLAQGADVKFDGDSLRLAIWQHPGASPRDLKIDAVLLAHTVSQHFPGVFERLDCSFFDANITGQSRRVAVKLAELKAFALGKLGPEPFLAGVLLSGETCVSVAERYQGLSYRQILDQDPVLDGSFAVERKELSDELTTLKANGYDVSQATRQFFALEDLVRTRQYAQLPLAFTRTHQCISEAVAQAQGISVASSRTKYWQR